MKDDEIRGYFEGINKFAMDHTSREGGFEFSYPELDDWCKNYIRNFILYDDYPRILKPYAKKLLEHTDINNLAICYENLRNVSVRKNRGISLKGYNHISDSLRSDGYYSFDDNFISYRSKNSIGHLFLLMASSPRQLNTDSIVYNGFSYTVNNNLCYKGLNSGYTELLSNRIFNNENYDTNSYRINVYLLLLFELLYENKSDMEREYLHANYQGPISTFRKYGSVEEYFHLLNYLDYFAFNTVDNDVDVSAKQIRELSSNLNKLNELIAGLGNNKVQEIQDKINEAKTKVAAMEGKTRRNEDGYSIDEGHFI